MKILKKNYTNISVYQRTYHILSIYWLFILYIIGRKGIVRFMKITVINIATYQLTLRTSNLTI